MKKTRRNRAATAESTLDEDRWIITPSRRTQFHKSHNKERKGGHWERGRDTRRISGLKANKKTTVSMSGCCGVIHNMQQTSFHVLKNPNNAHNDSADGNKRDHSVWNVQKNEHRKCPLLRLATHDDGWIWTGSKQVGMIENSLFSVSMCSPVYYVSSLSYALPFLPL